MTALLLCSPDGTVRRRIAVDPAHAYSIGRSPRCEVPMPLGSVSRRHALLFCHAGVWRLVDTGSRRGIKVDGDSLRRIDFTDDQMQVRIGPVLLRISEERASNPHRRGGSHFWNERTMEFPSLTGAVGQGSTDDASPQKLLQIEAEDGYFGLFDLRSVDHATIGFDPLCRIALPAKPGLAALHALVFRESKHWVVIDAGGGIHSHGERFLRRRLIGDVSADIGPFRVRMIEPTSVEPRRGDVAPRAVSAFSGINKLEDDTVFGDE